MEKTLHYINKDKDAKWCAIVCTVGGQLQKSIRVWYYFDVSE